MAVTSALMPGALRAATRTRGAEQGSIRDEFPLPRDRVYLNHALMHPMSRTTLAAVEEYSRARTFGSGPNGSPSAPVPEAEAKAGFANLINAKPSEIAFVPSTTIAEHLVAAGMGLPSARGNVVTDVLHYAGSLYMWGSFAKQGLEVRTALPRDGQVKLESLDTLIDRNTNLVAISSVSYLNGATHDLKAVCDLAHSRGAYVYADVIQSVGAMPLDVQATGVDFCACSTYKWLMGDKGVAFLYVREDLLDRVIHRAQYGQHQMGRYAYHFAPFGQPGNPPFTWEASDTVAGHFEVNTTASSSIVAVAKSMEFIRTFGVEKIQAHNSDLVQRLQRELPRLGYASVTPADTGSPIATFAAKDVAATTAKLNAAKVEVTMRYGHMRIAPSIYTTEADIDKLLAALS
jgi:selenocysteine lyase/cysteine desulfurase